MADIQHRNIPSSGCHEPKHISTSTASDSGKVITPSSSSAGQSVLRRLSASDIDGLDASSNAFGTLNANEGTTKTLPANSSTAAELNSLFTLDSSSESITTDSNQVTFEEAGTYLVLIFLSVSGTTDGLFDISYNVVGQGLTDVATAIPANGDFNSTFIMSRSEGDTLQFRGISNDANTVEVSFAKNITFLKVA